MDLEKLELAMQQTSEQQYSLIEDGYVIYRNFFDAAYVDLLREKAQSVFKLQFNRYGYDSNDFDNNMFRLFKEHEDVFINCGKTIQQGLVELYKLPLEEKLLNTMVDLGLEFPNICTRPVLNFNHPSLAKELVYYKTPLHQDWSSMQSSMDSLVVWVPLIDVSPKNGSVKLYPKTHKLGVLPFDKDSGFAKVNIDKNLYQPIQPTLSRGDIVIFSTLLVHESGDIENGEIRWSCHYRYNNLKNSEFINRGYPNPYVYKPVF